MINEESSCEPENIQTEERFIEKVHDNTPTILESDIESLKSLDKYYFKTMFPDYLYEINFPINCKLEKINNFSFSAPGKISYFYSIKFPPSLKEIISKALHNCIFLSQISFLKDENGNNNLEFIYDEAFLPTIIQAINIPENVKHIGNHCFPPTLQDIVF